LGKLKILISWITIVRFVRMSVASNVMTGVVAAPFLTILSALSLAALQRAIEWVHLLATTPQRGLARQLKPVVKRIDSIIERIFAGWCNIFVQYSFVLIIFFTRI